MLRRPTRTASVQPVRTIVAQIRRSGNQAKCSYHSREVVEWERVLGRMQVKTEHLCQATLSSNLSRFLPDIYLDGNPLGISPRNEAYLCYRHETFEGRARARLRPTNTAGLGLGRGRARQRITLLLRLQTSRTPLSRSLGQEARDSTCLRHRAVNSSAI